MDSASAIPSSIDTSTTYMGLRLAHPFMAGASPLSATLDGVRALEDAGAPAIVLPSLFEEQITEAKTGRIRGLDPIDQAEFAERLAAFPASSEYAFDPDSYLLYLQRVKEAVAVPVIASLNGAGDGAWLRQAEAIERAGADALELNLYGVSSDLSMAGVSAERGLASAVANLKDSLHIPVAVKLAPYFSTLSHMAYQLDGAGADALILFSRFYEPDIDIEALTVTPHMELSRREELGLRLRWLAILHGRVRPSLVATGGIAGWEDGVKAILAGAHAVQIVSALLRHGTTHLRTMVEGLSDWMTRHQFSSIESVRGRVSLRTVPDPESFERANYIRTVMTDARRGARGSS